MIRYIRLTQDLDESLHVDRHLHLSANHTVFYELIEKIPQEIIIILTGTYVIDDGY